MRKFLIMLVLACSAMAYIAPQTLHSSDAQAVALRLALVGFTASEYSVGIMASGSYTNYIISWGDEYYAPDYDDQDLSRLLASIMAAGYTSEETTWTSTMVVVGFGNRVFACSTAAARQLCNMSNPSTEDFMSWMLVNITYENI